MLWVNTFLYQDVLLRMEPDRHLYLAVHEEAFFKAFDDSLGRLLIENKRIQVVVYDPDTEVILRWIP